MTCPLYMTCTVYCGGRIAPIVVLSPLISPLCPPFVPFGGTSAASFTVHPYNTSAHGKNYYSSRILLYLINPWTLPPLGSLSEMQTSKFELGRFGSLACLFHWATYVTSYSPITVGDPVFFFIRSAPPPKKKAIVKQKFLSETENN